MRRWRARTALVFSVLCRAVRDLQVPTSAASTAVVAATRAPGHMPRDPTRCRPRYRQQALRCGRERSRSSRVWVPRRARRPSSSSPYTLARTRWHGSRKVRDRSLIRARSREEAHRHQRGRRVQPRTKSRRGPVSRFCQGATGAGRISARLRSRLSLLRRCSQGRLIAVSSRRVGENIWSTGPTPICQDLPLLLEERLSSSTKRVWLRETTLFLTWFSPPSRWQ